MTWSGSRNRVPWLPASFVVAVAAVLTGCGAPSTEKAVPPTQPRAATPAGQALAVQAALRPSGPPKFIVAAAGPEAVFDPPSAKEATSYIPAHAVVLDARTGRALHTITAPPGIFSSWPAVAAAPDDRTFVIAGTTGPGAGFAFFTVRLDDQGHPGVARKVPAPLPAADDRAPDGGLECALSPDGRRLAYTSMASRGITVVDIVTGARRTWAGSAAPVTGLQWAGDGRRLWLWTAKALTVLDTTLPGAGPARTVATLPDTYGGVVTPDGQAVIGFNGTRLEHRPLHGGTARTIARLGSAADGLGGLTLGGDGRLALYTQRWRIHRVDLTTGRTTSFPVRTGKRQGKGDAPGVAW